MTTFLFLIHPKDKSGFSFNMGRLAAAQSGKVETQPLWEVAKDGSLVETAQTVDPLNSSVQFTDPESATCEYCGKSKEVLAAFLHESGHGLLMDLTCADRFGLLDTCSAKVAAELDSMERQKHLHTTLASKRKKISRLRGFIADSRDFLHLLRLDNEVVQNIRERVIRNPDIRLSEAQVALLHKVNGEKQRQVKEVYCPVPEVHGPVELQGKVLATKTVQGSFGPSLKMLVAAECRDGKFKAWGTMPASLRRANVDRGVTVRFLASKLDRSKDDETFGFFSKPSQAQVLEEV